MRPRTFIPRSKVRCRSAVVACRRGSSLTVKGRDSVSFPAMSRTVYVPGTTLGPESVPMSFVTVLISFAFGYRRFQKKRLLPTRVLTIESAAK